MVTTCGMRNILPKTQVLGLPGFQVLRNSDNQQEAAKPEDLFSNVLMWGNPKRRIVCVNTCTFSVLKSNYIIF
jgi:hypothetical protein